MKYIKTPDGNIYEYDNCKIVETDLDPSELREVFFNAMDSDILEIREKHRIELGGD